MTTEKTVEENCGKDRSWDFFVFVKHINMVKLYFTITRNKNKKSAKYGKITQFVFLKTV